MSASATERSPDGAPRGSGTGGKITRDDIEGRLRTLQTGVTDKVERTKGQIIVGAVAAVAAVLVVTFLLGKRKGRKSTTVVEIRRV